MHVGAKKFAITILFASVALGQPATDQRVFHFTYTETLQGYQEIATVMRTIAHIRDVSVDRSTKALALRGTVEQMALAEWLFNELDGPASGQPIPQDSATHEYRVPGSSDDVVKVFHLVHAETAQGLQEIVTAIRTAAHIQRIFPCNAPRALALRGKADQIILAERVIRARDKPEGQ
jgi:hypothetical protein